jgi:hypothetical protein
LDSQILAEGGMTGGWDPRDHAHFLKLLTQLSSSPAVLCARISAEVPGQTPASAMNHLEWHENLLARLQTKKELIAQWKLSKTNSADQLQRIERQLMDKQEAEKEEKRLKSDSATHTHTHTRGEEPGSDARGPSFTHSFACVLFCCVVISSDELVQRERAEKAQAVAEWKARKAAREEAKAARARAEQEEKERLQREKQDDERVSPD